MLVLLCYSRLMKADHPRLHGLHAVPGEYTSQDAELACIPLQVSGELREWSAVLDINYYDVIRMGMKWVNRQELSDDVVVSWKPDVDDVLVPRLLLPRTPSLDEFVAVSRFSERSILGTWLHRYVHEGMNSRPSRRNDNGVYDLSAYRMIRPRRGSR